MKKKEQKMKKKQNGLWIGLTLTSVVALMLCDSLSKTPQILPQSDMVIVRHDAPTVLTPIILEQNKYGDYLAGMMAQRNQDYDQTILSFRQALADDPNNEKLKVTLYLLNAVGGHIDQSLPLAKELQYINKPELMIDYVLIADALNRKDYTSAEQILNQKRHYGPDGVLKPALSAWILAAQGKRAEAEKALSALKNQQSKSLYHYYRALLALIFSDSNAAESAFKEMSMASEQGYPSLSVLPILRQFYQKQKAWQDGQADYNRITSFLEKNLPVKDIINNIQLPDKMTPEMAAAISFYDVSVALSSLKLTETCLILNEIALYLYPDANIPKVWGGELMETAQNYQGANRIYDRIPIQSDVILMKKAVNLTASEKYSDAIVLFEQLAQRVPQDAYLHILLGDAYTQVKDWEKAATAYQKAAILFQQQKNKEKESEALFALGAAYDKMSQTEKSEKAFLDSIKANPNNSLSLNYLGYLWLDKRKNIDEAFNMVKRAADLLPDDPNIMDSLALGYYLKQDYQTALELAEKSTDLISYSSVAYAHLGDIYNALGRKREARYQYRKALDLTSDITPELKAELEQKLK